MKAHRGLHQSMTLVVMPTEVFNRTRWQRQYSGNLFITDALIVISSVTLAQYVGWHPPEWGSQATRYITFFSVAFAAAWIAALSVFRTRSPRVIGAGIDEYRRIITASFWTFGAIAIVALLAKLEVARGYLAVALPIGTIGLALSRWLWRIHVANKRAEGEFLTAVLAIGDLDAVSLLAHELTRDPRDGYRIVAVGIPGYGPPRGESVTVSGQQIPILGDEAHALDAIRDSGADTVAVTDTEHFGVRGMRQLIWDLEAMEVDLVVSPGVMDIAGTRLVMRPVAGFPLLHVEKPQYHGAKNFQKRAFDFCFASMALLVMAPLLVVAAIAIKATSRGPILYASERIGINGRPFAMLKLRTMVDGADKQIDDLLGRNEAEGGILFKIRDDPRVTTVGKVLRRFSIDELPQFLNVLRQDMSVVGPRPPLRREVETYDGEVQRKLLVKPGITGLWQVSGRSDLSWDESVRLDLSYIENWSMAGDLVIIAKTSKAALRSKGAY